jgi:hypothetical protein
MSATSKYMRGQMTVTANRGQTSEGATVRRAMFGYPADLERLTYVYIVGKCEIHEPKLYFI